MEIIRLLDRSKIILDFRILDFGTFPSGRYYKLKIVLVDHSILQAREFLSPYERNYAFHWMDKDKNLIIRWDNAPYHPKINSFPHHKHERGDIMESYEISLEEVVHYIESLF